MKYTKQNWAHISNQLKNIAERIEAYIDDTQGNINTPVGIEFSIEAQKVIKDTADMYRIKECDKPDSFSEGKQQVSDFLRNRCTVMLKDKK